MGGCALNKGGGGATAAGVAHSPVLTRLLCRSQNLIFRFLQSKQRICIWLYENTTLRIEGRIIVRCAVLYAPPPRSYRSRP